MNTKKKKIIHNDKRCSKKAFVKCVATELYSVFKGVWGHCPQQANFASGRPDALLANY